MSKVTSNAILIERGLRQFRAQQPHLPTSNADQWVVWVKKRHINASPRRPTRQCKIRIGKEGPSRLTIRQTNRKSTKFAHHVANLTSLRRAHRASSLFLPKIRIKQDSHITTGNLCRKRAKNNERPSAFKRRLWKANIAQVASYDRMVLLIFFKPVIVLECFEIIFGR